MNPALTFIAGMAFAQFKGEVELHIEQTQGDERELSFRLVASQVYKVTIGDGKWEFAKDAAFDQSEF